VKENVAKSRKVLEEKDAAGISIYGVSTGFGGSADTRTDDSISQSSPLPRIIFTDITYL
jgi:phenylalanine ammonia-lyase